MLRYGLLVRARCRCAAVQERVCGVPSSADGEYKSVYDQGGGYKSVYEPGGSSAVDEGVYSRSTNGEYKVSEYKCADYTSVYDRGGGGGGAKE